MFLKIFEFEELNYEFLIYSNSLYFYFSEDRMIYIWL
jgi:hypothetical protein